MAIAGVVGMIAAGVIAEDVPTYDTTWMIEGSALVSIVGIATSTRPVTSPNPRTVGRRLAEHATAGHEIWIERARAAAAREATARAFRRSSRACSGSIRRRTTSCSCATRRSRRVLEVTTSSAAGTCWRSRAAPRPARSTLRCREQLDEREQSDLAGARFGTDACATSDASVEPRDIGGARHVADEPRAAPEALLETGDSAIVFPRASSTSEVRGLSPNNQRLPS